LQLDNCQNCTSTENIINTQHHNKLYGTSLHILQFLAVVVLFLQGIEVPFNKIKQLRTIQSERKGGERGESKKKQKAPKPNYGLKEKYNVVPCQKKTWNKLHLCKLPQAIKSNLCSSYCVQTSPILCLTKLKKENHKSETRKSPPSVIWLVKRARHYHWSSRFHLEGFWRFHFDTPLAWQHHCLLFLLPRTYYVQGWYFATVSQISDTQPL